MYTNADQLTSSKKIELEDRIRLEKPAIIAVCEMKPKNAKIRSAEEYAVPGYTLYDVNLDALPFMSMIQLTNQPLWLSQILTSRKVVY